MTESCETCDGDGSLPETMYGLFGGGDPRDFSPDTECCSSEEIERHKQACREWDEGKGTDRGPSCATRGDGSIWTGEGFGIGVYRVDGGECPRCLGTGVKSATSGADAD